jgi:hypothetical protein
MTILNLYYIKTNTEVNDSGFDVICLHNAIFCVFLMNCLTVSYLKITCTLRLDLNYYRLFSLNGPPLWCSG